VGKITYLFAVPGFVLALGLGDAAVAATAAEILGWCRADSPEHSAELCEGYVGAIAKTAAQPDRITDKLGVACIPESTTVTQLAALVVEKLRPGPNLKSTNGFEAIAPIFISAFPCSR